MLKSNSASSLMRRASITFRPRSSAVIDFIGTRFLDFRQVFADQLANDRAFAALQLSSFLVEGFDVCFLKFEW